MQTIIINRKRLRIAAPERRCLEILRCQGYAALKSAFAEGSGNYRHSILPRDPGLRAELGITEKWNARWSDAPRSFDCSPSPREIRFFQEHPLAHSGIFGNPRRIKAILGKLDGQRVSRPSKIKKYDSLMWFGTTIRHDAHDGSDITEASMIEAVTSRIKDIFEHEGEFENAVELVDTCRS